ncbi:MAG TPA: alpha/beta fold hydrolase [Rhodanobacter sp.]|nr:alpha/beta fold hydrolase [Rhodanobacter sp.]
MYHAPATMQHSVGAVLLCPPFGQEYARTHRLYRQLASQLASRGYPCLRFDYYGSGDSAGDAASFELERCRLDLQAAAAHLRDLGGGTRLHAFGTRLGASLLMRDAVALGLDRLLLWDPVTDGADLVVRMDALQMALVRDPRRFRVPRENRIPIGEWCGFTVMPRLREQLMQLRPAFPALATLLIESNTDAIPGTSAPTCRRVALSQPTPWEELGRQEIAVLSHELVRQACDWLETAP